MDSETYTLKICLYYRFVITAILLSITLFTLLLFSIPPPPPPLPLSLSLSLSLSLTLSLSLSLSLSHSLSLSLSLSSFSLQTKLYQFSRLLHDQHPAIHAHLEENDVSPFLYAAPWFLTIFSSQFPIPFVARVFGELVDGSTHLHSL